MNFDCFYIRVDASPIIGGGHFSRCLSLAQALVNQGSRVYFLCRFIDKQFAKQIFDIDASLLTLPPPKSIMTKSSHSVESWLCTSEEEDIEDCKKLINHDEKFAIIVDHYAIGKKWSTIARKMSDRVVFFDDLANRELDVDFIINQNVGWKPSDYINLVDRKTNLLLGPSYALLANNYSTLREKALTRSLSFDRQLKVLVAFGSSDPDNITCQVVKVLSMLSSKLNIVVTIVIGNLNKNVQEIKMLCSSSKGLVRYIECRNNLAEDYLAHDIVIGGAGVSSLERCCLGVPSIIIPIADNQKHSARVLGEKKVGLIVEKVDHSLAVQIKEKLMFVKELSTYKEMSNNCMKICDGLGSYRVATILRKC